MKLLTLAALFLPLGFSQSTECDTLDKCQEVLKTNQRSSFVHFQIGEIHLQQANADKCTPVAGTAVSEAARANRPFSIYPASTVAGCTSRHYVNAANEFRASLNGDLEPRWTEVWAHINLGKIFDVAGQRDRALNEYRLAFRTKDNTRGALDEAKRYTQAPYKPN